MLPLNLPLEQSGECLKSEAHDPLEHHREALLLQGRRLLLERLLQDGEATADDIRNQLVIPPQLNPIACGAIPGPLVKARIIRRDGFVDSNRPTAHCRPISRWRLVDPDAASRWLESHPERPVPDQQRGGMLIVENAPVEIRG